MRNKSPLTSLKRLLIHKNDTAVAILILIIVSIKVNLVFSFGGRFDFMTSQSNLFFTGIRSSSYRQNYKNRIEYETYERYASYKNRDSVRLCGHSSSSSPRFGYVGIIGAPNMGKSTLLNALLKQELCIATPKPQTTRHAILGILTSVEQNCQLAFLDTPGIIGDPAYKLQHTMMEAVKSVFTDSDVLLIVTDLFSTPIPSDILFQKVQKQAADGNKAVVVVVNKIDLVGAAQEKDDEKTYSTEAAVARWRTYIPEAQIILPVSAANAVNVDVLRKILLGGEDVPAALRSLGRPIPGMFAGDTKTLTDVQTQRWIPESPGFLYNSEDVSDRSERFFCAEIIRSCLFENLGKELPYCCEVRIESFREPKKDEKKLTRIGAEIVVERSSQKGIVIGTKGDKIKTVGTQARKKLQTFLETKVHLDLSVKVDKDWRNKDDKLKQFGYKR